MVRGFEPNSFFDDIQSNDILFNVHAEIDMTFNDRNIMQIFVKTQYILPNTDEFMTYTDWYLAIDVQIYYGTIPELYYNLPINSISDVNSGLFNTYNLSMCQWLWYFICIIS